MSRKYRLKEEDVSRDIKTVTKDPNLYMKLTHKNETRVIKALLTQNPNNIFLVDPKYISLEISKFVLDINPSLEFFPPKSITRDIGLYAVKLNASNIKYIPKEIIDSEIVLACIRNGGKYLYQYFPQHAYNQEIVDELFKEIVDEKKDYGFLEIIPTKFVTRKLLQEGLDSGDLDDNNPWVNSFIEKLIPDYKITPELRRKISFSQTDQGSEGTCGRHAFPKVMIKNVFELLYDVSNTSDKYNLNNCNQYLKTHIKPEFESLTIENCSQGGYYKILFFIYLFNLFQTYVESTPGYPKGYMTCYNVSQSYSNLYKPLKIPYLNEEQEGHLNGALTSMKHISDKYHISLATFHFKDVTLENIQKITDHGLYLMLRIEVEEFESESESDSESESESVTKDVKPISLHSAHFVIIIGVSKDKYVLIKNSWNESAPYTWELGKSLILKGKEYDKFTDCSFVIPIVNDVNVEFRNLDNIDEYLQRYEDLKRQIQSSSQLPLVTVGGTRKKRKTKQVKRKTRCK